MRGRGWWGRPCTHSDPQRRALFPRAVTSGCRPLSLMHGRQGARGAAAARLRRGVPDAGQRRGGRGRDPGGARAPDASGDPDRRAGRLDHDRGDAALDQRPPVGADASRGVRRAVAAGAAGRGPGARPGLTRRARGFAVARHARAAGAAQPGRAGGLPAARGVRLRVRADRRDHRADRGELAADRDAGAEASRGQPPALRRRRGRPRRLARTVPRGRRGGRAGGPGGAARQGRRPVRGQRRQGEGAAGAARRRGAHRALHGRRVAGASAVRRVREPAGAGERTARPPRARPGRAAARGGRARRDREDAGAPGVRRHRRGAARRARAGGARRAFPSRTPRSGSGACSRWMSSTAGSRPCASCATPTSSAISETGAGCAVRPRAPIRPRGFP